MPKTTARSPPSKTGSSSPSKPIYLARFGFSRTKRSSSAAATGDDSNVVEECASPPKRQRHTLGPEAVQTGKENGGRTTTTTTTATTSGGASSSTSTGAAGTSSGGAKSSTVANGNGAMTSGGNKRAPLLDLTQDCSSSSDSSDRVAGSSSAAKRMGTSATEAIHQQSLRQRRGKRDKSIGGLSCSRESLGSSEAPIAIHDDEEIVVVVKERSESIARGTAGVVRSNYNAADKTSGNGSGGGDSEKSNRWRGSRQSKKQTPLLQTSGGSIQSYFSPSKEGGFAKR